MSPFKIITLLSFATINSVISKNIKLSTRNLFVLHEWKEIEFKFPSESDRDVAIKNKHFLKGAGIPIDFGLELKEKPSSYRIFITLPRLTLGIPYTLATVEIDGHHESKLCFKINMTFLQIDKYKRLWVIDSGQIASVQFCPPQILAFDLGTDRLILRYTIPETQYIPGISVFTSLVVDCGCKDSASYEDAKVYIADSWGYGLIVLNPFSKTSWRVKNPLMHPENNLQRDGIFTMSLSPCDKKERSLYFHTLGSKNEIVVPLEVIDDQSRWLNESKITWNDFKILGSRGIPCESETMDNFGNLYCSVNSLNVLIRWESKTEYNSDNLKIYAYNPDQIKFVTGMKVVKNSFGEDVLWMLSNEPKLFSGVDIEDDMVKSKLIGCRIRDLSSGRICTVEHLLNF